jgi:hypothetical protein
MKKILLTALLLSTSVAHAWPTAYEVRAPIGAALVNPTELNSSQPSPLEVKYSGNFGADGIIEFDNYGVGLRFDSISAIRKDGAFKDGDAMEIDSHQFSLLGRKRWDVDESKYLAVLGTIGFYTPSYVNIHKSAQSWIQYQTKNLGQFSVAAEGGFDWKPFIVSAELGYQYLVMKDLESDQGARLTNGNGDPVKVDLSGPYIKAILGLRF